MWNKRTKAFLIIYISCLFIATCYIVPTITSFYYYAWGKHLAWSYFDGPPMIAYFFSLSHALLGNTFFSINIVGFLCFILSAFYIYKTGYLLRNQHTGLISALIWAVLPTSVESIFIRVLYDAPLNLFTIVSFYYFARYIVNKKVSDLYRTAFFTGMMILSKYTAAVSIFSLLVYIIFSQRQLFKQIHFYLASCILILLVTPMLYWNIKHDWISISYLLHFHSQAQSNTTIIECLLKLLGILFINYSIFLLIGIFGWFKYRQEQKENSPILEFNCALLVIGILFWMIATLLGGEARAIYLAPLGMNIALLAGYSITRYQYKRLFMLCYPVFLFLNSILIIANAWPVATYLKKGRAYTLIEQALMHTELLKKNQPLVTGYYTNAAAFNFFMQKDTVYAIPCGDINQYQFWNAAFIHDLMQGKINKISYIDFRDTKHCAEQFFTQCHKLATLSQQKMIPLSHRFTKSLFLYIYECSHPRKHIALRSLFNI